MSKHLYREQAGITIKNLGKRNIEGYYFDNVKSLVDTILKKIRTDSVVAYGGSVTLEQIGILDALRQRRQKIIEKSQNWQSIDYEKRREFYLSTYQSDVYLMSANAVTLDGMGTGYLH